MADLTITAANVVQVSNASILSHTAGAAVTAGQLVYLDSSTQWALCDADASGTASIKGVALHDAAANQPLDAQIAGTINLGATLTVGTVYVCSTTAGGIAPWADLGTGDFVSVLGVATTTANLLMGIINSGATIP